MCACVCLLAPNNVMIPAIIYKFQILLILNVSNAWHKNIFIFNVLFNIQFLFSCLIFYPFCQGKTKLPKKYFKVSGRVTKNCKYFGKGESISRCDVNVDRA